MLLPGVRPAVHAAGRPCRGAAGLAGDGAGGGALPPPVPAACSCRVPAAVTAPGPPKAIGKGLVSNGFIAMLLTGRYVAGRSQNSLVAGLARQGADISSATLTGTAAAAGALLAPLEGAIVARSRDSWHLHADETTWHVFAPARAAGRPAGGYGCSSARTPPAS
jgi:Transposase IS66 family